MFLSNALNHALKAGETMRAALEATAPIRDALARAEVLNTPTLRALEATAPFRDALVRAEVSASPTLRALRTAAEVAGPLRAAFETTSPLSRLSDAMVTSRGLQLANAISPIAHAAIFGWSSPHGSSKARDDVAAPSQPGLPLLGYADPSKAPPLASPEAPAVQPSTDVAAHAALEPAPVAVPNEEAHAAEPQAAHAIQCPTDDVAGPALDVSSWPNGLQLFAAILGPERALEVANASGGRPFAIPKRPTKTHPLAAYLRAEEWRLVTSALGGQRIYLALGTHIDPKKPRVIALLELGLKTADVVRQVGCSDRYVQRLRKELGWKVN